MFKKPNCKICNSDQRKEIERDIIYKKQLIYFKKTYGVGPAVVKRHKTEHMPQDLVRERIYRDVELKVPEVMEDIDIPMLENAADFLLYYYKETEELRRAAKADNNRKEAMFATKLIMEIYEMYQRSDEIKLSMQAQASWELLVPKIKEALAHWPEASRAVGQAILEYKHTITPQEVTR